MFKVIGEGERQEAYLGAHMTASFQKQAHRIRLTYGRLTLQVCQDETDRRCKGANYDLIIIGMVPSYLVAPCKAQHVVCLVVNILTQSVCCLVASQLSTAQRFLYQIAMCVLDRVNSGKEGTDSLLAQPPTCLDPQWGLPVVPVFLFVET